MSIDFSIVIPHRGNGLGLWATVHSCEEDLIGSPYQYEYVIVSNGEKPSRDDIATYDAIERTGKLGNRVHSDEPMSPPQARQLGVEAAQGKVLFFFDDHCLVSKRYFERGMARMEEGKVDLLHSATAFYSTAGIMNYHYILTLDYNFWGKGSPITNSPLMYPIAMAGHGGFVMKKSTWGEIGGYGPTGLLDGYGGEEPIMDLKLWRLGKVNQLDPKLIHYHFPATSRGYKRHFSDDYYTNCLVAANVIGGNKWMYKVFDSLLTKSHIRPKNENSLPFYTLLENAEKRSTEYAKYLDSVSVRTLDECLAYFREKTIAY